MQSIVSAASVPITMPAVQRKEKGPPKLRRRRSKQIRSVSLSVTKDQPMSKAHFNNAHITTHVRTHHRWLTMKTQNKNTVLSYVKKNHTTKHMYYLNYILLKSCRKPKVEEETQATKKINKTVRLGHQR